MRTTLVVACLSGLLMLFASDAEARKWTVKGEETEAEFVSKEGKSVTLRGTDGKEFVVKMGQLGEEDRKYVKQQAASQEKRDSKDAKKQKPAEAKQGEEPKQAGKKKHGKPDEKPANATWRMTGEYASLAGKWVESEEGKRYVTITQDGNKFVGKSNVFNLGDGADRQYRIEGTITKGGRVSGTIVSSKNGHDEKPGPLTGKLAPDGKTVRIHSKEEGGESDWTLTWNGGEEPKQAGKKKHGKKPHSDDSNVAKKDKPGHQPEEASSDQPKTMIVEAKGSGKDRDEALKDAFRDAVRRVVGAYVEEDTVVKNDRVIKDQVLTYSGGCVKNHEIVSDYKDGSITIRALVEQDKVIKRLKAANISVKEVAGGKMWDEMQSKRWKDKEAADLLRSVLKGFSGNCMRAEVVGEPKHEDRGSKIEVTVAVQFHADEQAFKAFRERLMNVLDHVAEGSEELLVNFSQNKQGYFSSRQQWPAVPKVKAVREQGRVVKVQDKGVTVFVNTSRNELGTTLGWRVYHLGENLKPVLTDAAWRIGKCVLYSRDTSGESKPIATFHLCRREPFGFTADLWIPTYTLVDRIGYSGLGNNCFFVTSTFLMFDRHKQVVGHQPKAVCQQKLELTESELKNLREIKCELQFSEGVPRKPEPQKR